MSTVTPITRTLTAVLRRELEQAGRGVRLLVGETVAIPDTSHVTIRIQGQDRTMPRLESFKPTVGNSAYCLVTGSIVIAIGEVV
jgi:hypothetical protein